MTELPRHVLEQQLGSALADRDKWKTRWEATQPELHRAVTQVAHLAALRDQLEATNARLAAHELSRAAGLTDLREYARGTEPTELAASLIQLAGLLNRDIHAGRLLATLAQLDPSLTEPEPEADGDEHDEDEHDTTTTEHDTTTESE